VAIARDTLGDNDVLVKMRVGGASNGSLKQILRKSWEDISAMRNNGVNPLVALPYKNLSKLPQFLGVKSKGEKR